MIANGGGTEGSWWEWKMWSRLHGEFYRTNISEWHVKDVRGELRAKEEEEGRNES